MRWVRSTTGTQTVSAIDSNDATIAARRTTFAIADFVTSSYALPISPQLFGSVHIAFLCFSCSQRHCSYTTSRTGTASIA